MRVSVIIPTFRRPANLFRCLDALKQQRLLPDEVLVAVRADDPATRILLETYDPEELELRVVPADLGSASEARNRCLDLATGEILVMTDDDTVAWADWLAAIHERFAADSTLGGLGGPDWINGQIIPPHRQAEVVGVVQWWGRCIGNHHRGSRVPLSVEWLKGANMSFRREALRGLRFGRLLRGRRVQFGEDFMLSSSVKRAHWKLLYDPAVMVDHYPGELTAGTDHRALPDSKSLMDAAHNETVALLEYLPPPRRLGFLLWSLALGTRLLPGAVMALYLALRQGRMGVIGRCLTVWRGRTAGWKTWHQASATPANSLRFDAGPGNSPVLARSSE